MDLKPSVKAALTLVVAAQLLFLIYGWLLDVGAVGARIGFGVLIAGDLALVALAATGGIKWLWDKAYDLFN